jgi:hypothetical protein
LKILSPKSLFAISAMTALVFSSCSRQVTSLSKCEKMVSANILSPEQAQTKVLALTKPDLAPIVNPIIENNIETSGINIVKKVETTPKRGDTKAVKFVEGTVKFASETIKKEFKSRIALITSLSSNHHTASISGTDKTQGLGGIAAICAIAAIAMAVFGLTQMGAIFWYLSVILIIAAVVFFLVYLAGKAASPSPGGE